MFSIIRKHLTEFKSEKANFIILIVICVPLLVGMVVSKNSGMTLVVSAAILYSAQVAGKFFANESSGRTIETTLTLPLSFYTIFFGKAVALFVVLMMPVLILSLALYLKQIITQPFDFTMILDLTLQLILALFTIVNITMLAMIISFKASNVIECAIKLPVPLILISIPYVVFQELIQNSEASQYIIMLLYILCCVCIFFLLFLSIRKYSWKPQVLQMVTSRKE